MAPDADSVAAHLATEARAKCWCGRYRDPCSYHEGFIDGVNAVVDALQIDGSGAGDGT